jgi:Mn-dependent DtxR family transcriptional regulator
VIEMNELDKIKLIDDVFEVFYFLQSYALLNKISISDIEKMLSVKEDSLKEVVNFLEDKGLIKTDIDGTFYLTIEGLEEAKEKFEKEFEIFHGGVHGLCNDPSCACQTKGVEYCKLDHHNDDAKILPNNVKKLRILKFNEVKK